MNVIETLNANADKTPDEIAEVFKPKPKPRLGDITFTIDGSAIQFDTIMTHVIHTTDLAAIEMRELSRVFNTRIEPSTGQVIGPRPDRERSIRSLVETYRHSRTGV